MDEQSQGSEPSKKRWYANPYVILTMFISGAAIAVAGFLLLLLPRSSEILAIMQWRMVRAKSFYAEVVTSYSGTREAKDRRDYVIKTEESTEIEAHGWVDKFDPDSPRLQQEFGVSIGAVEPRSVWAGEFRSVTDSDFVRFSELPPKVGVLEVSGYADRWLRFDSKKIRRELDVPVFGGGTELTAADKQQLLEELHRTPFFRFDRRLGNETLAGVKTYHYQVTPEVLFFKDYYLRYEAKRLKRELTAKERQSMDTFFANVTPHEGEIWIGRGDYYLYRIRLRFHYDDGERKGVFDFTADFGRFNQPSGVEVPAGDAEDITGILESLLPGIAAHLPLAKEGKVKLGTATGSGALPGGGGATFQESDDDKDGLSNSLENFYRTNPKNPDTDGDGVNDGTEVANGTDPNGSGSLFDFGITDFMNKPK